MMFMTSVRERVRAEMIEEIKKSARHQLAMEGSNLSVRAVARDVGLVSSAVYRYFPSRDDLLTALIVDGYTALAERVEAAERAVARTNLSGRFAAAANAIRDWALANRAEYALLYGSPVPGYVAPQETAIPVVRTSMVMIEILRDGAASGALIVDSNERVSVTLRRDLEVMMARLDQGPVPPAVLARGLTAWAALFGVISFELFGHSVGITEDYDSLFENQLQQLNRLVGAGPRFHPAAEPGVR